jgi:indole-3-acetate monooxygenase
MKQLFPEEPEQKKQALMSAVEQAREAMAADVEEAEKLRTLPPASVAALRDTGLLALKTPAELGGAEADPVTQIEVIEAVSYISPSAGWYLFIGAATAGISGAFLPEAGIAEMFTGDRFPLVAGGGGLRPGRLVPVEGGYRLTGRWSWGSGIRHAQWLTIPGRIGDEDDVGHSSVRMCVVPTRNVEVHDNWYVMGLSGTGSCDYSATDLFVPEHFTHGELNTAVPKRGGPLYRLGIPAFIANENSAFSLGVARRALDEVIALARSKSRGYSKRVMLANRGVFQRAVGRGALELRAARALLIDAYDRAWTVARSGKRLDPRMQAELRGAGTLVSDVAVKVATDAFAYGAGTAMRLESVLQRCFRDLHAADTHFLASDSSYENYGQFLLGLPDADPLA